MTIRVIAAVVDTKQLRLYKEDGSTVDIPQGDPRLAQLLEQCKPLSNPKTFRLPINGSGQAYVEIEFEVPEKVRENAFGDYEKKAGGFTKFFRVVKTKISHLFGDGQVDDTPVAHVPPTQLGELPTLELNTPVPAPETPKMNATIANIMAHAEPVSSETFDDNDTTENHTIVAVTDNGKGKAVAVPGVEALKGHIAHAAKLGSTKGMDAFLKRLGAAITQRGHTVQDVLKFMERGDLPVADDGCIIAYKVLQTADGNGDRSDLFVDCHSRKIKQRVGSYVCQDEKLVDPSRRTECSTGLHIARRGYLGSFNGNIIVMVKIRPEDVIAVPHGDANKIRVKGYHILAKIPSNEHSKLRSNTAMTDSNALKLLTMAIAGEHIGIIEEVRVTKAKGGGVIITPMNAEKTHQPSLKRDTAKTAPIPEPVKKVEPVLDAPKVDPKAVAKEVEAKKAEAPKTKAQEARELYVAGKYAELKAFKKAAKKGYDKLGFTPEEEDLIVGSTGNSPVTNGQPAVKPTPTAPAKEKTPNKKTRAAIKEVRDGKAQKTGTVAETMKELNKPTPTPKKKETKPVATTAPTLTGTRAEVARTLFDQAVAGDKSRWGTLWRHQKDCKKSWQILGFTAKEIERIKVNKPDHI